MPLIRRTAALACLLLACDPGDAAPPPDEEVDLRCGPARGVVADVIDGDTVRLASGEKIRYLMVDTPEITQGKTDCFGREARDYNAELVLGQEVELTYDEECSDAYGRLLAYVESPDGEINTLLVERGFACVLHIPPNGDDRESEFMTLELEARGSFTGMWGACGDVACAR
jgi:micrococcal nuclease